MIQQWILDFFGLEIKCYHETVNWRFVSYHTTYDHDVYVQQSAKCHSCGKSLFRHTPLPPLLRQYFWDNFDACMAEDPRVIANKERLEAKKAETG